MPEPKRDLPPTVDQPGHDQPTRAPGGTLPPGASVQLEQAAAEAGPLSRAELLSLVRVDQRERWRHGEGIPVEAYLEYQPELQEDTDAILELILREVCLREDRGQAPRVEEYVARFPQYASQVRRQFALHGAVREGPAAPAAPPTPRPDPIETPAVPPTARLTIAGYEVLGELGRGGMGVVYKARQVSLDRVVALKMILAGVHADPESLVRFKIEAEAAARLQHPYIVQIYEISEHDGRPFFSLEYIDGGSLESKYGGQPVPPSEAAEIVEKLARAIHVAHQRGVLHRDLKPANILLTPDGTPKITDFGLAKKMDSAVIQTQTGDIMGTPNYMAPEQAAGRSKEMGPATDVYALGAILYDLLTGRPPFQGATLLDTLEQVRTQDPVPPRRLSLKVPRDLETICLRSLEKEPRKRYASAEALAEDLRRFREGEPILARLTPAWERAWKWGRRRPAMATFAACAVLAAVGLLAFGGWYHAQLQVAFADADDQRATAQTALAESRQRLVKSHVTNGTKLMDEGDLFSSLVWFGEALKLNGSKAEVEALHRLRIGAVVAQSPRLSQILFHDNAIEHAAFSPDGKRIATASADGTARVWDRGSGSPVTAPLKHDEEVVHVAFSPDGRKLATACEDQCARVWDIGTGKVLFILKQQGQVRHLEFSPSGQWLATAGDDGTALVFDATTGQPQTPPLAHQGRVNRVGFSPDSRWLLTAGDDHTVRVWEVASGKEALPQPLRHAGKVLHAEFSPDGKMIATASADQTARVWDAAGGKPLSAPIEHRRAVRHAAFSPDSQLLVTSSEDNTARLSEFSGKPLGVLKHASALNYAAFSPDGRHVATASDDNTGRIWDVATSRPTSPPLWHNGSVLRATFSPDGQSLLTASDDGTVRVWETSAAADRQPIFKHDGAVHRVAFSPDGRHMLTAGADGTARLWDSTTGKTLRTLKHERAVLDAQFSRDGKRVVTASEDGSARVWNTETGKPITDPLKHTDVVYRAVFSRDGRRVITASRGKSARVWDAGTGQPLVGPLAHDGAVLHAEFSPDGRRLVTASADGTARIWDAVTGQSMAKLEHQRPVNAASFGPDSQRVITASEDQTARLWDAGTGKPLGPALRHASAVKHAVFSPDGQCVLTSGADNTARIWDPVAGKHLVPPLLHSGTIQFAGFSPDGRLAATASDDSSARVWSAQTGEALTPPLRHAGAGRIVHAAFSPDSKRVASAGEDGTVRMWQLAPDSRPAEAVLRCGQFLSGFAIDATGGLVPLDSGVIRRDWKMMK